MTLNTLLVALAAAAALATPLAQAQDNWPTKPVKITFGFPAGSATDVIARTVGQKLSEKWGQPVVIENKPGAGGNLGSELAMVRSPASSSRARAGVSSSARRC